MQNIKEFVTSLEDEFLTCYTLDDDKNNELKFSKINQIIEIKKDYEFFNNSIYLDIKKWFRLYIAVIDGKGFNYDELSFNKVRKKISYLEYEQQSKILVYFIKVLKQSSMDAEIHHYLKYQRKVELHNSIVIYGSFLKLIKNIFFYNLFTLLCVVLISIIILSYFWQYLQIEHNLLSIDLLEFSKDSILINYLFNFVCIVFNLNGDIKLNNIFEIVYFIVIKIYFFLLITYYVIKEVSSKLANNE